MPARLDPKLAYSHGNQVVELEGEDGGTATLRLAENVGAVMAPAEVIAPGLLPRMEKLYQLAGLRIEALGLIRLETVAQPAREPQICLVVGTSRRSGKDVLDLEHSHHKLLRTQTVSASISRLAPDTIAQLFG